MASAALAGAYPSAAPCLHDPQLDFCRAARSVASPQAMLELKQRRPASLLQAARRVGRNAAASRQGSRRGRKPLLVPPSAASSSLELSQGPTAEEHPTYSFFLPCWRNGKATIHVVSKVRQFYPTAPLFLVGNGYYNYTKLCQKYACNYVEDRALKPRKNTRGLYLGTPERNVYFSHLKKACEKSSFLILLEDDVRMLSPIKRLPPGDAGGITDNYFNGLLPNSTLDKLEAFGRKQRKGFKLEYRDGFQLAGGSYMRCAAFLDALERQPPVDTWEMLEQETPDLNGSDAILFELLTMAGYAVKPWEEASTTLKTFNESLVTFVHDDKSLYNLELTKEEASLVDKIPSDWLRQKGVDILELEKILAEKRANWQPKDTLLAEKLRKARKGS
mmetsp:Transcript_94692/g.203322  ORF Transcript_94692/g.203322 Transcript_94692/m.203322 type:complete len:389 (-) Transcript_94692:114-1280(-)